MSTQATEGPRFFYYYPAFNEQYARRVLAGLASDDGTRIDVAEAICYPGSGPMVKTYRLVTEGPTTLPATIHMVDPGIKPDAFTKKEGKRIARERVTGIKHLPGGKTVEVGQDLLFSIPVPAGEQLLGKLFKEEVEKYLTSEGFPEKPKKEPKG